MMKNERKRHLILVEFLKLVWCLEDWWHQISPKFAYCVSVLNKHSFKCFCVWILFKNTNSHFFSSDFV